MSFVMSVAPPTSAWRAGVAAPRLLRRGVDQRRDLVRSHEVASWLGPQPGSVPPELDLAEVLRMAIFGWIERTSGRCRRRAPVGPSAAGRGLAMSPTAIPVD